MIGGELRATSRALVGPLTRLLLEELHVDRALMGTFALSLEDGLTTTDPSEAFTKELVLARAREVILLADSTKIGTRSFVRAGRLDRRRRPRDGRGHRRAHRPDPRRGAASG